MKRQSTRLLFVLLIVTSCQEQNIVLKKDKLSKIAYTSLDKEPMLNQAIQKIGLSAKGKGIISGRIMDDISNYKADSILKVLQADSSNYTYTIPLDKNPDPKSFKNLVFKRVSNGFLATVLDYVSDSEFYDLDSFSGSVKVYNLGGVLLQEFYLNKAKLNNKNGRTQGCTVNISKDCIEWYQPNNQYSRVCVKWATTIIVECTSEGSGSGNNSNPLPYSFIPDGSYGGGAPGTGGQPADSYIVYGPWAADPIAVLPPPIWPGSKLGLPYLWWEDETWLDENVTDPETKRKAQLDYIRISDGQDGRDFSSMIDEIIRTPNLTVGESYEVNGVVNNYYLNLRGRYMRAVIYPVAKAAQFIIELAMIVELTSANLNLVVKGVLLTRYGIALTRLTPTIALTTQELLLGIKNELRFSANQATLDITIGTRNLTGIGNGNTVYNFSGVSQAEARAFFDKISGGNAIKVDIPTKGSYWRTGLGENKQMIQYRNFSTSNGGEVTIEFKIESIRGDKMVELKFWP
jgi:hypothetical protein